jgi:hypothetical protein
MPLTMDALFKTHNTKIKKGLNIMLNPFYIFFLINLVRLLYHIDTSILTSKNDLILKHGHTTTQLTYKIVAEKRITLYPTLF